MGRAAIVIQQFDADILWRKVGVKDGFAARRESVAFDDFRRERIENISFEIRQYAVDDAPQHSGTDAAHGFINWDDASDFRGVGSATVARAYRLDLRVQHFQTSGTIEILVDFAVQNQLLTFF